MAEIDPKVNDPNDRCETCHGTGFISKMLPAMPGEPMDGAVDVCPTCDGTGSKSKH